MRKSGSLPLLIVAVIAIGVFVATLALGNKPGLGLDLQGGISVVLQPVVNGQPQKKVPAEALDQTKQIIENRVNAIGVGEPDITVQGKDILVELPGIKDQKRALSLVGQTAQLRFRPVLSILGSTPGKKVTDEITKLRKKLKVPKGVTGLDVLNDERTARGETAIADPNAPTTTTVPGATTTTAPAAATTTVPATSTTTPGNGTGGSSSAKVARLRADSSTTTVAPTTTEKSKATTTTVPATTSTTTTTIDPAPKNKYKIKVYKDKHGTLNSDLNTLITLEQQVETNQTNPMTPEAQDKPGATVTLPGQDTGSGVTNYKLGPQALSGSAIEGATAGLGTDGKWTVNPEFKDGPNGIDKFNAIAAKCNAGDPVCPAQSGAQYGQLAIVLDGVVISAPTIEVASFQRNQIQISGSFTNQSANDLATALRYGSLPLTLKPQTVETVSATLGKGALKAGLIAGAVGLGLVALFLIAYYRILGLVTLAALATSGMLLWTIIGFLGAHVGLTLTLSGIVGIVVSIGVSLDSSVVYYESLKEDVRNGKSMRTAVDRSYSNAFGTIVKADVSSLIGAVILYWLSIGPVKGFALYLGLSTVLDLFTSYFITRPAVALLGKSKLGVRTSLFGIPTSDLDESIEPPPEPKVAVSMGTSSDGGGES